ncbi:MAG: leucine-rich repeat domain-containing protein [Rikenellaceae bacterium]
MSIETEILRIEAAKENIASAISDKGITVPSNTLLDDMPALIASIEINSGGDSGGNESGGGSSGESNNQIVGNGAIRVRFIDPIDGVFLTHMVDAGDSIDIEQITPLTHDRLTFECWSKTGSLSNIQTNTDVGAVYTTTSGNSELDYDLTNYPQGSAELPIKFVIYTTGSYVTVNWGDGQSSTSSGGEFTPTNTIESGKYTLSIESDGVISFDMNEMYSMFGYALYILTTAIRIGNNVETIPDGCFKYNTPNYITLPLSISSIGFEAFAYSQSIENIVFPPTITQLPARVCCHSVRLQNIVINDSVLTIAYEAFKNCYGLRYVVLNNNLTAIGNNLFYNSALVTYCKIPQSVTSIGSGFLNFDLSADEAYFPMSVLGTIDMSDAAYPPTLTGALLPVNSQTKIIIPENLLLHFGSSPTWSQYSNRYVTVG